MNQGNQHLTPNENMAYASKNPISNTKPSWARLWRQVRYVPCLHNRWLNAQAQAQLTQAVSQAEQGHNAEIRLIIENHLPIATARLQDCYARAIELFGLYGVWDTAENTGVLVYLNLCERRLEIIADRGIHAHITPQTWQMMCDEAILAIKQKHQVEGLCHLLAQIADILRQYQQNHLDLNGNELDNNIVILK